MTVTAEEVIARLGLEPLEGEGGYFAETYRTDWKLTPEHLPDDYPASRSAATAIYFLVTPEQFSALHRLRGDELWHFYLGDPVELVTISPDGNVTTIRMGPNVLGGDRVQALAPGGHWLGCSLAPGGSWALLGTTMTPGFHPDDFEPGDRAQLVAAVPHARELIERLTR
jgi:predicted cupin superfamily sugar epimerase